MSTICLKRAICSRPCTPAKNGVGWAIHVLQGKMGWKVSDVKGVRDCPLIVAADLESRPNVEGHEYMVYEVLADKQA